MQRIEKSWWKALLFGFLFVIGYKVIDNFPRILQYVWKLIGIITPFIIGGVIAFFLHKPVEKLEAIFGRTKSKWVKKHARTFSLLIIYILFLACISFVVSFVLDSIFKNIADIIANWDSIARRATEIFDAVNIPQKHAWLDKANQFLSKLLETEMILKAGNIVGSVAGSLVSVFTGLIISIYMIVEKESLKALFRKISRWIFREKRAKKINLYLRRIVNMFYSYFTGLAIDAILVGTISVVFYMIYGVPYAWLFGLVVAVGNLIPFFGPIVAAILVALATLIALGPINALWVLVFQIVLGQVDGNVIQPKIVGNSVGISPFWVIFAVIFFGGIWGAAGMLLGVPLVAAVRMVVLNPPSNDEAAAGTDNLSR